MSINLVVLCLAGFGLIAWLVSGSVRLALPFCDALASRIRQRHRVWLWLGLGVLPLALGASAVIVSFFPAWGLAPDHCLGHGQDHPHLCPHHLAFSQKPGLLLFFVAAAVVGQTLYSLYTFGRAAFLSARTARALQGASCVDADGNYIFPGEAPEAFVVGLVRPRVFVSRELLALGADISESVIAHERVHATRRDSLWRACWPLLTIGHVVPTGTSLWGRLTIAQEQSADEEGALSLTDGRLSMASALVALARTRLAPAGALSFTEGDVAARVSALVHPPRQFDVWSVRMLVAVGVLLPVLVAASHDHVHHALETLLGSLS